jgi:hypothetical protein
MLPRLPKVCNAQTKSAPIPLSFKVSTIQTGQEHALQSSVVKKGRSAVKDWPFRIS